MNITEKYRPRKFSQLIGQASAVSAVVSKLNAGNIPPAYIAYGLHGCGKTSIATLLAMSLNCKNRDGVEPCGVCEVCEAVLNSRHEMFTELDAASNSGVADMRELMASIKYVVPEDSYRVVVIDECQSLTKQAWQTTLKTIERPPPRVLFVFCTTEYQAVPNPVKSRCVQLQFTGVGENTILSALKSIMNSESVEYEEEALSLIAKYAYGSIRDAQSILEGFISTGRVTANTVKSAYHTIDSNTIMSYFNALSNKKIREAASLAGGWMRLGCTPEAIAKHLLEYLSNMIMDWNIQDKGFKTMVREQREKLGEYRVSMWIDTLLEYTAHIKAFPAAYTLLINNMTIKLASHIFSEKQEKKSKSVEKAAHTKVGKEKDKEVSGTVETEGPKIDQMKLVEFQRTMGLQVKGVKKGFTSATITHPNGHEFEVVIDPETCESGYYLLYSDLDSAIANKSLKGFIKKKEG